MSSTTLPISADDSPRRVTVEFATPATSTARFAMSAAVAELLAISLMLAPICSVAEATVDTLVLTSSAAADTTVACAVVSSDAAPICSLTVVSSAAAEARVWALSPIAPMLVRSVPSRSWSPAEICSNTSMPVKSIRRVRSPAAAAATTSCSWAMNAVSASARCTFSVTTSQVAMEPMCSPSEV